MIGPYKRSKFMAEQVALEAARNGMDVVVVNPTTPVGERDIKPTPTGRIVVDFLKKKFPAYVDTGLNLVDATECARGHVMAFERGRSGERYILGSENLTLKQILDKLAAITGLPSPTVRVPHFVALGAAVVDELWTGRIRGLEPRATVDAVQMGRKKMFVNSAKAERELGWKVVPVDGSLRRAVDWFRAKGYA
jgi:dihydroflavonol-4-reductase